MAGGRRTPRDRRRRTLGQNLLVDDAVVRRLLARLELGPGERVVEIGPGTGALTLPLARAGVDLLAVERDPVFARQLRDRLRGAGLDEHARVVHADLRRVRLPSPPYRVVSNVPFNATTALLARLLDDPDRGPWRADLLVQAEVARKRAAAPPTTLRSAAWSPWWTFELGEVVPRTAFRPVPRVDAAWLTVRRRTDPVLPAWLAPGFRDVLEGAWDPPPRR